MKIGIAEIIVICIIALVVIGPDKLPFFAKKLGTSLKEVKKVTGDLTKDIRENIVEPLNEASAPLKEAIEPIVALKDDVNKSIDEVTKSVKSVGKTEKKEPAVPQIIDAEVTETAADAADTSQLEEPEVTLAESVTGRKVPRRSRPSNKTAARRRHV